MSYKKVSNPTNNKEYWYVDHLDASDNPIYKSGILTKKQVQTGMQEWEYIYEINGRQIYNVYLKMPEENTDINTIEENVTYARVSIPTDKKEYWYVDYKDEFNEPIYKSGILTKKQVQTGMQEWEYIYEINGVIVRDIYQKMTKGGKRNSRSNRKSKKFRKGKFRKGKSIKNRRKSNRRSR